jgi:hypothetical protein
MPNETVELPRAALALLLAAGRAVYQSSQVVAQQGGAFSGLRYQWDLAQAINAADAALETAPTAEEAPDDQQRA